MLRRTIATSSRVKTFISFDMAGNGSARRPNGYRVEGEKTGRGRARDGGGRSEAGDGLNVVRGKREQACVFFFDALDPGFRTVWPPNQPPSPDPLPANHIPAFTTR